MARKKTEEEPEQRGEDRQERIERLYPAEAGQGDPAVQEAATSYAEPSGKPAEGNGEVHEREITDGVGMESSTE